jgi:hypothetical protein
VGEDGELIAQFMVSIVVDERARTADRIEAGKWLADRGFGKAPLVVESGETEHVLREFIRGLSTEDLDAMLSILEKYSPVVAGSARTPVTPRGHETDFRGSMEGLPRLRPHFVEGRSARG